MKNKRSEVILRNVNPKDIPNITGEFFKIGSEEAAMILGEVYKLRETLSESVELPSREPTVVAEVLNRLYTQDEFYELVSTEVGKGIIIGTVLTAYLYSGLMKQGSELNEITDIYGCVGDAVAKYFGRS